MKALLAPLIVQWLCCVVILNLSMFIWKFDVLLVSALTHTGKLQKIKFSRTVPCDVCNRFRSIVKD